MRLEHPIFKGPLDPRLEFGEADRPVNYLAYPGGAQLPETLPVWRVQQGEMAKQIDYGLVSDPLGFEDAPDAEWISSGINSKGPTSVALGRHGNQFLWGFAGDPTQMTESGRRVFLNAVVYMAPFEGERPLVPKTSQSRDWAFTYIQFLREYKDQTDVYDSLRGNLTPECGDDIDALEAYYRENLEFVHMSSRDAKGRSGFVVDPDVKSLGVSNRRRELFEAIEERLAADPKDALALRVLERYVHDGAVRSLASLRTWRAANEGLLFFSDVGGYQWFVDTNAKRRGPPKEADTPFGVR